MTKIPSFRLSRGGLEIETAGQPKFCLRYFPVHILISVPGIVENRKMEILSSLVYTWPPHVYNSANRDGAKFCTLTERMTVHCCYSFEKALHASACTKRAHANCGRPGREFTTPYGAGQDKAPNGGSLPLLHYTLSH